MRKGNLTQAQAIAIVGAAAVALVEAENCDFTNRVQTDGDDSVEFSASVRTVDADGDHVTLTAYYYQSQDDLDAVDSLDQLTWEIEGYEIH